MIKISGTEGYAEEAAALLVQYESISFQQAQGAILHLIPSRPCRVLDIVAGTGRDAAGFAALGHRVLAVEPTREFRTAAAVLHANANIEWLDDSLPELARVRARGAVFDIVMLNAVWMHLDEAQRRAAMPNVASLVAAGGLMIMSLRYGPVPPGRRMFAVAAEETIGLAEVEELTLLLHRSSLDSVLKRPGVSWTRLAFTRGDAAAI